MTKKSSISSTIFGLVIIAVIAICGAYGQWSNYWLPPIVISAASAVLVQWVAFGFAWKLNSERFFDLLGSATFAFVVIKAAVYARAGIGLLDIALICAVCLWAFRLGSFLLARVQEVGSDRRFNAIKQDFSWFLMTWTLQATWVVVTTAPAVAVIGDGVSQPLGLVETLGLLLWLIGFAIEVVADEQKKRFRLAGNTSYIRSGLWSRSRHPNYFGEILLWSGLALAALPSLSGLQLFTLVSPLFVWTLLMKVSGVPMLEAKAEHKWGSDPDYVAYKSKTPLLIPRLR